MPEPQLSIVIPVRNRPALLAQLLASIDGLEAPARDVEVIVVDDGSSDDLRDVVEGRTWKFSTRRLRRDLPAGPADARNQGAAAARGRVLGFLDSDVTVDPRWWQAAAQHFRNPQVAAVEGATLAPEGSGAVTPFTHFVHNRQGNSFQTCNFFCRRDLFLAVGGFDPRFCWRDGRGRLWHVREDTDLAFSLLEQGRAIVFEPGARAFHPLFPEPRLTYFYKTYYGRIEALLRRKHPRLYRERLSGVNGRAFPAPYWGIFVGLPLSAAAWLGGMPTTAALLAAVYFLGWAGSVYLVCRKRQVSWLDLAILVPQFFIIPWMRLFWVCEGLWHFRDVKPAVLNGRQ